MGRALVQDCKILPVFPPVFPSQACWPLSQENTNLMSGQCDSGACMSEDGFNALFLPSWDHYLLPQGFPLGSDSWASAGITWTLNASLVLVAARRMAKRHAKGSPGLLAPSCQGIFCFISVTFINLPLKHTTEKSFKNGERLCTAQSISRLAEGVHRGTHTLSCCIIRQAVQYYFFIAILPPTPSLCLMPWKRQLPSSLSSKNTYRLRKHFTRRAASDV